MLPCTRATTARISKKCSSYLVENSKSTHLCFVLVCPEGAEAEMIQLARRWDSSVTGIYEHRPPIRAADVSPQCPVTNELRTFRPDFTTAIKGCSVYVDTELEMWWLTVEGSLWHLLKWQICLWFCSIQLFLLQTELRFPNSYLKVLSLCI